MFVFLYGGCRLLVIGQQLHEPTGIGLVDEARAPGARLTLQLARFVAEIVATIRRVPLEAFRCLAKTLRRGPVGFQLGHFNSYCIAIRSQAAVLSSRSRANPRRSCEAS